VGPLGDFSNEASLESPVRGFTLTFEEEEVNPVEEAAVEGDDENDAAEEEDEGSPAECKGANKLGEETECEAKSDGEELAISRPGGRETGAEDADEGGT
jgi:hypothetical protein